MRYLMMFKPDEAPPGGEHACKQELPEMAQLFGDLTKAGVLLSSTGLYGSEKGARLRYTGGAFALTDGPFAEAKELVGGVALVEVPSKAEAVELARRFLRIAGGGEAEVREVMEVG